MSGGESVLIEDGVADAVPGPRGVRDLWQVPVFTVGALVLASGMYSGWVNRPQPDIDAKLDRASELVERGQYGEALAYLNADVRGFTSSEALFTDERRGRFHLLRAQTIDLTQLAAGESVATNHERILEEYDRAEKLLGELSPEDRLRRARALASVGRDEEAWEASRDGEPGDRRVRLRRELVARRLETLPLEAGLPWLDELRDDPAVTLDDGAWLTAREAEGRIEAGFSDVAISKLLQTLPRLQDADPWTRGELFLLLGEAYAQTGDAERAAVQLERADELVPDSEPLSARILRAQATLLLGEGDPDGARTRYDRIVTMFGSSESYVPALLGLATLEAAAEDHDAAAEMYGRVVEEQRTLPPGLRVPEREVWSPALEWAEGRLSTGDAEGSLRYAEALTPMFVGPEEMPTDLLRILARANAERARQIASAAIESGVGLLDLADVDPVTRNAARERFVLAGEYYGHLADRVVLTDDVEHADAVWGRARAFDLAGDQDRALRDLTVFVGGFPEHPRRAEARFRLARTHMSRGEYARAAELFSGLLSEGADGREPGSSPAGAGLYASLSYPLLARVYVLDSDPANDANAERLLLDVLRGRLGGPESPVYVDALVELSRLYYNDGRLPDAIERLEEAVLRTSGEARQNQVRYRLADARRREAGRLGAAMEGDVTLQELSEMESQRREHLRLSIEGFDEVRSGYEAIDPRRRSPLDEVLLRNAYFFAADSAFDLEEHNEALTRYTAAKERYPDDPASLVALMQIFNAYVAMGEFDLATTAGNRARRFYESLDEAVWSDPMLPLTREDWERWLDASYEFAAAQGAGG